MSPWEPRQRLLGNLYIIILGTLTTFTWKTWEPCRELWRNLEGTFWEPFGNLEGTLREPWEPLLGNLYLGILWNLGGIGFGAAPVCSETFTMAEDPKASAVGEKGWNKCIQMSTKASNPLCEINFGNLTFRILVLQTTWFTGNLHDFGTKSRFSFGILIFQTSPNHLVYSLFAWSWD